MNHHVIHTYEELEALDPHTAIVLGTGLVTVAAGVTGHFNVQALLPAVVLTTGNQVREARETLKAVLRQEQ